jgi:hypothetical protein
MITEVFPKQLKFLEAELEEKLKLEKMYGEKKCD